MPTRITALSATAVLALLLGCTQAAATPSPSSAPTVPPTPAPTATPSPTGAPTPTGSPDAPAYVLVKGNDTCAITSMVDRHDSGNVVYDEHFVCHRVADDPRISGTLEFDVTSVFEPMGSPNAQWTSDNYVLTNADGTWEGTAQGAVTVFASGGLMNYGRALYVGTGAYEGLRFTELIAATDAAGLVLGYISGDWAPSSAWVTSATRSSTCSTPTDRRTSAVDT